MDKYPDFWDVDLDDQVTCPFCGWEGRIGAEFEPRRECYELRCPGCERMLLIVLYPTTEETKRAAAAGNRRAQEALPQYLEHERFLARHERLKLKSPDQLPEIEGTGALAFEWDFLTDEERDERWSVIRHGERELWREPALWEGYERFEEVKAILKRRYGARFESLTPTERSEMWLRGDRHVKISTT